MARSYAPRSAITQIQEDHPQRLYLLSNSKPAVSLEAWFDAGLQKPVRGGDDDEVDEEELAHQHLVGVLALPIGYSGVNQDQILAIAHGPVVQIWPIRFDVGDISSDVERPWTLFHYTHRDSFEAFVRAYMEHAAELHEMSDVEIAQEMSKNMVALLTEDFEERHSRATAQNPRMDPECLLVEPGKFSTREEVLTALFGPGSRSRRTKKGTAYELIADYCIAFRVPGSACFPVTNKEQGMDSVRICRETLEVLKKRGDQRREVAMLAAKSNAEAKKEINLIMAKKKGGGCGCFGAQQDDEDDGYQLRGRKALQVTEGEDRLVRNKRELDQVKLTAINGWAKEHFINVQKKIEAERKVAKEEKDRIAEKKARIEAKKERETKKNELVNAVVMNKSSRDQKKVNQPKKHEKDVEHYIKAVIGDQAYKFISELGTRRRKKEISTTLYNEYRHKQEEEKDIQKPALVRIKLGQQGAETYKTRRASIDSTDSLINAL